MPDSQNTQPSPAQALDRTDRKFSVSANRGKASQKVRYVEAGGAAVDPDECTFCQAMPDLSDGGNADDQGKDRSS